MSANCPYIYTAEGLRFHHRDVKVIYTDIAGVEHLVNIRKSGTGKSVWAGGVPVTLTPRDMKKLIKSVERELRPYNLLAEMDTTELRHLSGVPRADYAFTVGLRGSGKTLDVLVSPQNGPTHVLKLDPSKMEGSPGRKSFNAERLAGLSPVVRRALALEQLRTAPYGEKFRGQAVARLLWSVEQLDDKEVASMLEFLSPEESWGLSPEARKVVEDARLAEKAADRSSTPLELAALLLSDERIVSALITGGKHSSVNRIMGLCTLSRATLGYAGRPAHEIFQERANVLLLESADPVVRRHAARYVRNQGLLTEYLRNEPDPDTRVALVEQLLVWVEPAGAKRHADGSAVGELSEGSRARQLLRDVAVTDLDPRVRLRALEFVDADEETSWLYRENKLLGAALFDADEQVRLTALALIEDDDNLANVAQDAAVDPGTAKAACDLLLAQLVAGPRTYRRRGTIPHYSRDGDGYSYDVDPQTYFRWRESGRQVVGYRTSLELVAKLAPPQVLEHIVDALAGKSATSDSRYLGRAIEVLCAVEDNPATSDALYEKTRKDRLSLELAKIESEKEAAINAKVARLASLKEERSRRYKESRDPLNVGLRHARAGNGIKAAQFLSRELVEAALACSTDPEEIRALAAFAAGDLLLGEAAFRLKALRDEFDRSAYWDARDYDEDTLRRETARLLRCALENPVTPSDALEDMLLNSERCEGPNLRGISGKRGAVDEDVFTDLLAYLPPEQRTRVAAIRAKGEERKRDASHREDCAELAENIAFPDGYSGAGNLWSVADKVAEYDRSTEADLENVLRAAQNVRSGLGGGWQFALRALLKNPNATPEQKARAAELLRQSGPSTF